MASLCNPLEVVPDMTTDLLQLAGCTLALKRPGDGGRSLRAWDAADELLLEQALHRLEQGQRVAIVDDQFGALTLGLAPLEPVAVSDSAMLAQSLALNDGEVRPRVDSGRLTSWLTPPSGPFDAIVLRIPRQVDYLAFLLRWANEVLVPGGLLIAGGMIKHLPDRSAQVFEPLVTTEEVCPARKKARVVVCRPGNETLANWPDLWRGYPLPDTGLQVRGLPAVFARDRLDIGTRLLLPEVARAADSLATGARVLDLACGNGVLGLAVLVRQGGARVVFADVSSQAIASARRNVQSAFPDAGAEFHHGDGIPSDAPAFDLILLNPPFHEGGVVGDHIALRLFQQAAKHLAPGGRMLMVGNRHLGYHRSLRRYFPQVRQLVADPKFVVFEARFQGAGRS